MRLLILILLFPFITQGQIVRTNPYYKPFAASCSYLLDQYSGAAAAYSFRLLDCQYAGSLIRVRRSSDNTEQDIGATANGDLDTAALKTFVGTGGSDDGFVTVWYDQSGNGRDMTQSTAADQPKIMDNGVVLRDDGYVSIQFNQANTEFLQSTFTLSQSYTIFSAARIPTASSSSTWYHVFDGVKNGGGDGVPGIMYNTSITQKTLIYSGTVLGDNTVRSGRALSSAIFNSSSSSLYFNNSSILSGNAGTFGFQQIFIGRNWNATYYNNVKYYELVIYGSDKSSDISNINTNINNYWGIY